MFMGTNQSNILLNPLFLTCSRECFLTYSHVTPCTIPGLSLGELLYFVTIYTLTHLLTS